MKTLMLNTPKNEPEVRRTQIFFEIRKTFVKFPKKIRKKFDFPDVIFCPKYARNLSEIRAHSIK